MRFLWLGDVRDVSSCNLTFTMYFLVYVNECVCAKSSTHSLPLFQFKVLIESVSKNGMDWLLIGIGINSAIAPKVGGLFVLKSLRKVYKKQ